MSPGRFALAVGADQHWIRNARRTLRRRTCTDEAEARWFGLVHELHASLCLSLRDAARAADQVIAAWSERGPITVTDRPGAGFVLTVDLDRARERHSFRLAQALHLPVPDGRGRPATSYRPIVTELARRARRATDPLRLALSARRPAAQRLAALGVKGELLVGLAAAGVRFIAIGEVAGALLGTLWQPPAVDVLHDAQDHASLAALASVLTAWRARPRGAGAGDWIIDAALIAALPAMALDTDLGALNVWTRGPGVGEYAQALERVVAVEASGFPFPLLDLEALTAMELGIGRTRNHDLLFELRHLALARERAARLERYRRSMSSSSASAFA